MNADGRHHLGLDANIILTGFMGTGKSSVGRVLAAKTGFELIDTDLLIEARHGPITEIFAGDGEPAFRELEQGVAVELAIRRRLIISTGGRLMLDPTSAAALEATGIVFCLTAHPEEIVRRVVADADGPQRPLLSNQDQHAEGPESTIRSLLRERAAGYGRFTQVSTDDRNPEQVADVIFDLLS